jgi:hypothetical protein
MEAEFPLLTVTAEEACDDVLAETVPTKTRYLAKTPILKQVHCHVILSTVAFGERQNSTLLKKLRTGSMFLNG